MIMKKILHNKLRQKKIQTNKHIVRTRFLPKRCHERRNCQHVIVEI